MFTNLIYCYLGGLIALTASVVAWSKENSILDIELRPLAGMFLILSWPVSLPIVFMVTRLKQI